MSARPRLAAGRRRPRPSPTWRVSCEHPRTPVPRARPQTLGPLDHCHYSACSTHTSHILRMGPVPSSGGLQGAGRRLHSFPAHLLPDSGKIWATGVPAGGNQVRMRLLGPEILGPDPVSRGGRGRPTNTRPWARASPSRRKSRSPPSPACASAFCLPGACATYRKGYEMAGRAFGLRRWMKENKAVYGLICVLFTLDY